MSDFRTKGVKMYNSLRLFCFLQTDILAQAGIFHSHSISKQEIYLNQVFNFRKKHNKLFFQPNTSVNNIKVRTETGIESILDDCPAYDIWHNY